MKTEIKKSIGRIFLICIYVFMGFLIFGYANIACSTMPGNILGTNYEPAGLQMLYFYLVVPVFFILSVAIWLTQKFLIKEPTTESLFPIVTSLTFFVFIQYLDSVVTFPAGNKIFYLGSLILVLPFFMANVWLATKKVMALIRAVNSMN